MMAGRQLTNKMAEIIVRVKDKINKDFYLNCQCTKRGDVIEVQEDGWPWGTQDLANPDWRLIKLPQYSVADLQGFLAPELPTDIKNPSKTLQRRAFKFDIDHIDLPQEFKDIVADDSREVEQTINADTSSKTIVDGDAPIFDIFAFKVQKEKIEDPTASEANSNVF